MYLENKKQILNIQIYTCQEKYKNKKINCIYSLQKYMTLNYVIKLYALI